mmetsp:Transcript_17329/g.45233  ORF Transcript_17329/g.45233 Transcript_17329/m.45233 type:complete len:176 (+) Transcript_17329:115-642(+)
MFSRVITRTRTVGGFPSLLPSATTGASGGVAAACRTAASVASAAVAPVPRRAVLAPAVSAMAPVLYPRGATAAVRGARSLHSPGAWGGLTSGSSLFGGAAVARPAVPRPAVTIAMSAHGPGGIAGQIRSKTYGREYQPSNLRRKRKHGFLNRIRTKSGRKVIKARKTKGRKNMSH